MNKIISINISGMVFNVDEQAYEALKQYLDRLRRHFGGKQGGDEIITDIESRIAELLQARLNDRKQVVSQQDVDDVIGIMGNPSEMGEEEPQEQSQKGNYQYTAPGASSRHRRIFRDPDDKVLGGVCSGVAAYINIDPVWIRLAFAVSFFWLGSGLLLYIVLWAILPAAHTTAEKLQMRGESVDINNIEKKVKEEWEQVQSNFNDLGRRSKPYTDKVQTGLEGFASALGRIAELFIKAMAKVIGVCFLAVSLCIFVVIIAVITGLSWPVSFNLFSLAFVFFGNNPMAMLAIIAAFLLILVPLISFMLLGLQLLFRLRWRKRPVGYVLSALMVVAILSTIACSVYLANQFSHEGTFVRKSGLNLNDANTLCIDVKSLDGSNTGGFYKGHNHVYVFSNDTFAIDRVELDVKPSSDSDFHIEQTVTAHGSSVKSAEDNAEVIMPDYIMKDSTLLITPSYVMHTNQVWRGQEVAYTLRVPIGKKVMFREGVKHLHMRQKGIQWNSTWMMTADGLKCLDCDSMRTGGGSTNMSGGSGRNFDMNDFEEVEIHGVFNAVITQGKNYSVQLRCDDESLLNDVYLNVSGNRLTVEMDHGMKSFLKHIDRPTVYVYITMPELDEMELTGASEAEVSGFKAASFNMSLSGVSKVNVTDAAFEHVDVELSGASGMEMQGTCTELNADLSGTSKIESFGLVCKRAELDLSGVSSAEVNVKEDLKVSASGSSSVRYRGTPGSVNTDVSGMGSVSAD